ncbi:AraC family transcriptional regulator [Paenibacillus roseipurpureus]|uniref:AraC family transcriptional regulator n=1 Tax=Paenibacillus roseopurpureus TaxID=2918901 RepID=A0AA96RIE3_9BACL|nr:AraC family transcriptional regulator [Paenibacillus sp. MBLB1832]WNR42695.1 AraC family transcriptional regulator [Paenibacillus sp. MBLB1832]
MKRIENINLSTTPYRLSFRHLTDRDYQGYYHCHQGMEFLFIHQGNGHVKVDNQIIRVAPGTLIYFQPYQLHRVQINISTDQPYERTVISFEPAVFTSYIDPLVHLAEYYNYLWQGKLPKQYVEALTEDSDLYRIFELFHKRLATCKKTEIQHEFGVLIIRLLHALHEMGFNDSDSISDTDSLRLKRHSETIMTWIEEHYMKDITLAQISEDLHLSKTYISRIFREETGASLMDYLTARRIRQATFLLHETDLPVELIGENVGFPNFSYFCQVFKKHTGFSPNQLRKNKFAPPFL